MKNITIKRGEMEDGQAVAIVHMSHNGLTVPFYQDTKEEAEAAAWAALKGLGEEMGKCAVARGVHTRDSQK